MIYKVKFKVDIDNLRDYYHTVVRDYQYLRWDHVSENDYTEKEWNAFSGMVGSLYGWGIDSNLDNLDIPCPPYNISTRKKLFTYRNTKLAFGIIDELQKMFPYAYKWAIAVQGPGGYVLKHDDGLNVLTLIIPIYSPPKSGMIMYENEGEVVHHFLDDGSLYLADTAIYHSTFNNDTTERVLINCRINKKYLLDLLKFC